MGAQAPGVVAGRIYLVLDGRTVAQVTAFAPTCDPGLVEEFGLDENESSEISPTILRTRGTIGLVRRVGDGGTEGYGMSAPPDLLPRKKYSTMQLVDLGTKAVIFSFDGSVTFGPENWQLAARGTMTGAVVFQATRKWQNEVTGAG